MLVCSMTACNKGVQLDQSEQSEQAKLTEQVADSVSVIQRDIKIYTSENKEKKVLPKSKISSELEKLFFTDNTIDCVCKAKTSDSEVEFSCTYRVSKEDDNWYIWDIEDIECLSIEEKSGVDIKGYINNVFSHTSLRANIKSGVIMYTLYDDTMVVGNNIENTENDLKYKILNKFTRNKKNDEFIVYDSVEGISYRGAYNFVSVFLGVIVGDLPFETDTMNTICKFDEYKEQTDKKQYLTNGNDYCVEKLSDNEYKISISKRESKYELKIKVR